MTTGDADLASMLTLVINLQRRPDRLAFMAAQLDALGLPFQRIEAVDGSGSDARTHTPDLSTMEHACALSHRSAWQRFLETEHTHCLILEDDVILAQGLKRFLNDPANFPPGVEALRLETRFMRTRLGPGRRCRTRGFKIHQLHSTHYGAAAYVVTRGFAEAATRELAAFTHPIDHVIFGAAEACFFPAAAYQLRPALCVQAELVAGAQDAPFARSDLEGPRRARLDLLPVPQPAPRIKVRRSAAAKCLLEIRRWGRKIGDIRKQAHERFVARRSWQDIAFAGPASPAAAALHVPGSEQEM